MVCDVIDCIKKCVLLININEIFGLGALWLGTLILFYTQFAAYK